MIKLKLIFLISVVLATNIFASYKYDDPTLGNIALEAGIWQNSVGGTISNNRSTTDIQKDLNFDQEVITYFGMDLKNDIDWLPNIYINYFLLNSSADSVLTDIKYVDNVRFSGDVSSSIDYAETNMILYGFLQQGPFEFDMGLNLKYIDFEQKLTENRTNGNKVIINGPTDIIPVPYLALKIDLYFIDTVLKAQTSLFSIGNTQIQDYAYSLNYRVMRNMYLSYGYRYNSFKATNQDNDYEKYNITASGSYISCKIMF